MSIATERNAAPSLQADQPALPAWHWVHVGIAALAMVLTLPGRTHGLGLFSEPLLKSLGLDRESYGFMNLWATLLGALFCLPCGWLLDRFGPRSVYVAVTGALGVTVVTMSVFLTGDARYPIAWNLPAWLGGNVDIVLVVDLFMFLLLTRGLGQSALSVVSLALIGRSAGRRSGLATGAYAFATSAGFLAAFIYLGGVRKAHPDDWRTAWAGIGMTVFAVGIISGLFIRNNALDTDPRQGNAVVHGSLKLSHALRTPAFWTFTLATSFYGMVVAGTSLFNESILFERGFGLGVFVRVTQIGVPVGLAANLFTGWLATRWPLPRLMAFSCGLLAASLASFSLITTEMQVYLYASALAAAGGAITVCFFTVYRLAFGPGHLGSIQGAAQLLTVLFSAVGPMLFASTKARIGSYVPLFHVLALIALGLAVATVVFGLPFRPAANLASGNENGGNA
jgi:MFS family permease